MLGQDVQYIKGIGPKKAEILKKELQVETVEDFLYFTPRRYIDRSTFIQIEDSPLNEIVSVAGQIISVKLSGFKRKFLQVEIADKSGSLKAIFWGGLRYFQKLFTEETYVIFSGKIINPLDKQMVHPEFDFVEVDSKLQSINTGRIIPLYRSTESLKKLGFDSRGFRRVLRKIIDDYLDYVEEPFEDHFLRRYGFMTLKDSLRSVHFPDSSEEADQARKRLSFNELFFLQYYLALSKRFLRENSSKEAKPVKRLLFDKFILSLPFELTSDQKTAIEEIYRDLESPYPMNRLLQGDVGSGKTVVALAASLLSISRNEQVAFMAPTEVLANQHYQTLKKLVPEEIRILILTGSKSKKEKEQIYESIFLGKVDLVIGTHALIQEKVLFKNLSLIIVDEQHRFGVEQRALLRKKGEETDLLVMSATPIPRSLSMTLYGDVEVSSIKTKPANRLPIKTLSFPESSLKAVYNSLEKYMAQGRQIYYVLPLIEESAKIDLKSALATYEHLKNKIFVNRRIALLHGRMKQVEKDMIMSNFVKGEIDLLVATTVIEVGIDVPNANVILIEHTERFGLAQLHQLRGRVGRGEYQSFCILIHPTKISAESRARINILLETDDGFKIAEEDLKIRGAGELTGFRQHGYETGFEFVNLALDLDLIFQAREEAQEKVNQIEKVKLTLDNIKDKKFESLVKGIRKKRILEILA